MTGSVPSLVDRRAIEALRSGVPNSDAVRTLGCNHPRIEEKFREMLAAIDSGASHGTQVPGLLVSGEFGSGKSHLLEYLQSVALDENFVCSRVVISKETPLSDPAKVFAAMASEGRVPGNKVGPAISILAQELRSATGAFKSEPYAEFFAWCGQEPALAQQFPATVWLLENGNDREYSQRIVRFWAGDPLKNPELKANLRALGQSATYHIGPMPNRRSLAFQRVRFAPRLARAAGYKGWIVLFDEVELIGRYTFRGRANAYAELARWMGKLAEEGEPDGRFPGLATVAAITGEYEARVLRGGEGDEEAIPNRLAASLKPEDHELGRLAKRGMALIQGEREPLPPVTAELMKSTHDKLQAAYSSAFGWDAPVLQQSFTPLSSDVMRPHVRRWITQWDIARKFPEATFAPIESPLGPADYTEDADLASGDGQGTSVDDE